MNFTGDQIFTALLFVLAGGTIWNYISLLHRFKRLAHFYKKDITDDEVEMIIRVSKLVTSNKWPNIHNTIVAIESTIYNYHDSCILFSRIFNELLDIARKNDYKEILDHMLENADFISDYDQALALFDTTAKMWPDFITRKEVNNSGNKEI